MHAWLKSTWEGNMRLMQLLGGLNYEKIWRYTITLLLLCYIIVFVVFFVGLPGMRLDDPQPAIPEPKSQAAELQR